MTYKRTPGSMFSHDGMVHSLEAGTPEKPPTKQHMEEIRKRNAEKEVCLRCTHISCSGDKRCFERRKHQMLLEGAIGV